MGRILTLVDFRKMGGKNPDYDWFSPMPGEESGYLSYYTDKHRAVPAGTNGSLGNTLAYNVYQGSSGRLILYEDVIKSDFEIDYCIPSIAYNCNLTYCPKGDLSFANLYTILLEYNNTTSTGIAKPFPYIITTTNQPIKYEYCLRSANNNTKWYYYNGNSWSSGAWTSTIFYGGGHATVWPIGARYNILGYKLYLFKCNYGLEDASYATIGEYLEYEGLSFNRSYLLANFPYKVYGNGVLRNWVYNNPLQLEGDRTGFIYKDNRLHGAHNSDNDYKVTSFLAPFLNSSITADIAEGYNLIGLEFAVSDLKYNSWTGMGSNPGSDSGKLHIVNCERPFITPRIPVIQPSSGNSVSSDAMARTTEALNLYPEILTSTSAYSYYGRNFTEIYEWYLNSFLKYNRYVYGMFYFFPICDCYWEMNRQNNLLYTMNRMGIELHLYGQASPSLTIFE